MNWQNVSDYFPAFYQRVLLSDGVDFQCGYFVDKSNYKYQVPQHGFEIGDHYQPPFEIKYWLALDDESINWICKEDEYPLELHRVVLREMFDHVNLIKLEFTYECGKFFGEGRDGYDDWVCDTTDLFDPTDWAEVILPTIK
jgi:hypothetical protein